MRRLREKSISLYPSSTYSKRVGRKTQPSLPSHKFFNVSLSLSTRLWNTLITHIYFLNSEISKNCVGYAKPSLCYSTFPICQDPVKAQKAAISMELFHRLSVNNGDALNNEQEDELDEFSKSQLPSYAEMRPRRYSQEYVPKDNNRRIIGQTYGNARPGYKDDSHNRLRRICREECEMLENELCRREYAIAKRHPQIGQQVPLLECSDLPEHDPDCLSLGIPTVIYVNESKS